MGRIAIISKPGFLKSGFVIQTEFPEDAKPGTDPRKLRKIPYWYCGLAPVPKEYGVQALAPLWSPYRSDVIRAGIWPSMAKAKIEADRLAKDGLHKFSILEIGKSKIIEAWPDPIQ